MDAGTSGILLFALNENEKCRVKTILAERNHVHKIYIAKVKGRFEWERVVVEKQILFKNGKGRTTMNDPNAKHAKSIFYRIEYDEKSDQTLILCKIFTGRRHQIRLHLKSLQFSIVNDTEYGAKLTQYQKQLKKMIGYCFEKSLCFPFKSKIGHPLHMKWNKKHDEKETFPPAKELHEAIYEDLESCLTFCLHSWIYMIEDQVFVSALPAWTKQYSKDLLAKTLQLLALHENIQYEIICKAIKDVYS